MCNGGEGTHDWGRRENDSRMGTCFWGQPADTLDQNSVKPHSKWEEKPLILKTFCFFIELTGLHDQRNRSGLQSCPSVQRQVDPGSRALGRRKSNRKAMRWSDIRSCSSHCCPLSTTDKSVPKPCCEVSQLPWNYWKIKLKYELREEPIYL